MRLLSFQLVTFVTTFPFVMEAEVDFYQYNQESWQFCMKAGTHKFRMLTIIMDFGVRQVRVQILTLSLIITWPWINCLILTFLTSQMGKSNTLYFLFFIELIGVTLVLKTIQVSSVQLNKTSSAHCIVHPSPQKSLFLSPFSPPLPASTPFYSLISKF